MGEGLHLLSGWGRTAPSACTLSRPGSVAEVRKAIEAPPDRGLIARGLARSYGDAAQCAGGLVLETTRLRGIHDVDVDGGVVTVDAGTSLERLQDLLVPLGLFPMVTPGTCKVTVGGALAADIHGKNHHCVGSFADHVLGFTLETPQGTRHVTREGDPDVFRATAGGMGLTGVVTQATIRMKRIRSARIRMDTERASDLDDAMNRMDQADSVYHYSVAWIDVMSRGSRLGRSVITRGDFAEPDELPPRSRSSSLQFRPSTLVRAPGWFPRGLLNPMTVRALNEVWFRKAPKRRTGEIVPLASYHHPLDFVDGWNRIYGARGFVQYQFVVPLGPPGEAAMQTVVERLSGHGAASFLAVLKRFGPGNDSFLSFPMQGWTLALDIPAAVPGLACLLRELDEVVLEAGGRLYLAKESRAEPRTIRSMYPLLDDWREVRAKLDPHGVLRSDLARRLELC